MEEWLNIYGYPEYQVSNYGRVKSLERKVKCKNGYRTVRERILKPININGYYRVQLSSDGKKKYMLVHRLVGQAFLPNPYNLPEVNHKNEIKTDNRLENLEYCDRQYNTNYGTRNERIAKARSKLLTGVYNTKLSKSVRCIETNIIYPSASEIQRQLGDSQSNISQCCNGKRKSAYKFHWEWV